MKFAKNKLILLPVFLYNIILLNGQHTPTLDSAYTHLKQQFDQYHLVSYVYDDDNCGGNIFIPSIWEGDLVNSIFIDQEDTCAPVFRRSCTKIVLDPFDTSFSAIKYVYPDKNIGQETGYDLSGASKLRFWAKGSGTVEFIIGGTNRRPFYKPELPVQDGIDLRGTGFIKLDSSNWHPYSIDLKDTTFWVYKDSTSGVNNRYCEPRYWNWNGSNFNFFYGAADGLGDTTMKVHFVGPDWGGVVLLPPKGYYQGYDLTGITSVNFRAKINPQQGNVKFYFGSSPSVEQTIFLDTTWNDYFLTIPSYVNCQNDSVGFGIIFGGLTQTPFNSDIYIDDVYYKGISLANDFSNVICGFKVSSAKALNPYSGSTVHIDSVYYDKNRIQQSRFCQSFVCGSDTIDITLKNRADVYDNALLLITSLMLFDEMSDSSFLDNAKLIGNALVYAMNNDRFYHDRRLRNSYMCGDLKHWDSIHSARIPGWWDNDSLIWFEDMSCASTSTGNVAWAGLALTSLYEATLDTIYLEAAKDLADWCLINTMDTTLGFTGGFEGWEPNPVKVPWKSTEHNLDLYPLFMRLDSITNDTVYNDAAISAKYFVISMWDTAGRHFWTGTDNFGNTNTNPLQVPLDIQAWYIMAFRDVVTNLSDGINWANSNCYLANYQSPNYPFVLNGFDFNSDKDGVWMEGTSMAALANSMKHNNPAYSDSVLACIGLVQDQHNNPVFYNMNYKGIVAADHNNTTTGFTWNYHNRLHIGATCWYIMARLKRNPFYYKTYSVGKKEITNKDSDCLFSVYPNPAKKYITINVNTKDSQKTSSLKISLYNIQGKCLFTRDLVNTTTVLNITSIPKGIYFLKLNTEQGFFVRKFLKE